MLRSLNIHLANGIRITYSNSKLYLIADAPLRFIYVPKFFCHIIEKLHDQGCSLSEIYADTKQTPPRHLTYILFTLLEKGYLRLSRTDIEIDNNALPTVSVIIPVKNRPKDISDCLRAISNVDYPESKLEVIVVDDGSSDNTTANIRKFDVRLIPQSVSKGPAACRNLGAGKAKGDILVFLDSDCVPHRDWLKQIVPFLSLAGMGAVGGVVDNYFDNTCIDRYEAAFSSLNMGERILFGSSTESNFYVPSCNFFIRRDIFNNVGGFTSSMHVGEDVDLCWRMRKRDYFLLYVPFGSVAHKHRSRLGEMLRRRAEYGTSEGVLYKHHPDKKKVFKVPVYSGWSFIAFLVAVVSNVIPFAGLCVLFYGIDVLRKKRRIQRINPDIGKQITFKKLCLSTFKSHFSLFYYAGFFLIRYFMLLFLVLGLFDLSIWLITLILVLLCSGVDYCVKKPKLNYPVFLLIYVLEHCAYQTGVFIGCIKHRYLKCYIPLLRTNGSMKC